MHCRSVKKKLSAYMDNALHSDEQKQVMQHLNICQNCSSELKKLQNAWDLLGVLPEAEKTSYFYTRLKARIESSQINRKPVWKKQIWIPFAFALAMFAGLFLGQSLGRGFNGNGSNIMIFGESYSDDELLDAFNDFPDSSMGAVYLEWVDSE